MIRFLARAPLIQFLVIGALLFAVSQLSKDDVTRDPRPIVVDAQWTERAEAAYLAATGRRANPDQLEAQIQAELADEILYRRALELGLDRDDRMVQSRLIRNVDFLDEEGIEGASAAEKLARARSLGIDRSDVVVRRRLIQRMRQGIESAARRETPDEADLRAYYDEHPELYGISERVTIETRFFAPDDEPARARAARALAAGPERIAGDPPPVGTTGIFSERALAKLYGKEWAAEVMALPTGRWSGPVLHSAGAFLVLVSERIPARPAPFEEVRGAILDAVAAERGRQAVADAVETLRPSYIVVRDDRA